VNIFARKSPLFLAGELCRLEQANERHVEGILKAVEKSPFNSFIHVPKNLAEALLYVKEIPNTLQFVIVRISDETIVGCTRLQFHLEHMQLGWTWLQKDARGTGINLESKIILFRYLFEVLRVNEVYITVPTRNTPSIKAMKKLTLVHVTENFSTVFCLTRGEWTFRKDQIIEASKAKGIHLDPDIL